MTDVAADKRRRPGGIPGTRQVTRDQIVQAADSVFLKKGFSGATVQEIAREAGYTTGAIYRSFDGKADLFLAVYHRRWRNQQQVWRDAVAAAATADDIPAMLGATLTAATYEPEWYAAVFEFFSYATRDERLLHETGDLFKRADSEFVDMLRDAGILDPDSVEQLGPIINGLLRGLAWSWVVNREAQYEAPFIYGVALLLKALDRPRRRNR